MNEEPYARVSLKILKQDQFEMIEEYVYRQKNK